MIELWMARCGRGPSTRARCAVSRHPSLGSGVFGVRRTQRAVHFTTEDMKELRERGTPTWLKTLRK